MMWLHCKESVLHTALQHVQYKIYTHDCIAYVSTYTIDSSSQYTIHYPVLQCYSTLHMYVVYTLLSLYTESTSTTYATFVSLTSFMPYQTTKSSRASPSPGSGIHALSMLLTAAHIRQSSIQERCLVRHCLMFDRCTGSKVMTRRPIAECNFNLNLLWLHI